VAPTTIPTPLPGLGVGARGPEVQALEERLAALHYDVGDIDGHYDSSTFHAVMAFQKVTGLQRTGRFTDDVAQTLATATDPPSLVPGGGPVHVEVDLPRQVLFLYVDNALFRILPVSTGSGSRYCVDGECARAVTPGGSFRMTWFGPGWATSRLGRLYNAVYFNGGIAIHGATSVPAYPASHGCVRIPMGAAEWFPSKVSRGTPVYVVGGEVAPVPFNEPAPNEAQAVTTTTGPPPPEAVTTTTMAPAPPPTIPIP
jgi:peptidoglycan hydrolase-like protein with peptidoglycan-binding domain